MAATDAPSSLEVPTRTIEPTNKKGFAAKSQALPPQSGGASRDREPSAEEGLRLLEKVAEIANRAAKLLAGAERDCAYAIKSEALSTLIVAGRIRVNGKNPNGTLGLSGATVRLHAPVRTLRPEARAALKPQIDSARSVTSLRDRLEEALESHSDV